MKQTKVWIINVVFLTAGLIAQINFPAAPVSFRSQALGGVIYDDLDLIYDPIELRFVKGFRLYTNLSNLTSGQEQILNGVSDNEFLVGMSAQLPMLLKGWTAFLIRYQNSRFSNPVQIDRDLDGTVDRTDEGYLKNIYNAFLDTDFDGFYDIRQTIVQEKTNLDFTKGYQIIWNNSFTMAENTVGLRLHIGHLQTEDTRSSYNLGTLRGALLGAVSGDPSFSKDYQRTLLQQEFVDYRLSESGDFGGRETLRYFYLNVAFMRPVRMQFADPLEVRLDAGFLNENYEDRLEDVYEGREENFRQGLAEYQDFYTETETMSRKMSRKGRGFEVDVSLKHVFDPAAERKNDGFWKMNFGWRRFNYNYTYQWGNHFSSRELYFDGMDTLAMDYVDAVSRKNVYNDEGPERFGHLYTSVIVDIPFDERVYAGLRVLLSHSTWSRDLDNTASILMTRSYQVTDDTSTYQDFTREESISRKADHTYEHSLFNFIFAAGIEYKFTRNLKWSLRFGSVFNYRRWYENDAFQITTSTPYKTVLTRGDGSVDVDLSNNIYNSASSQQKEARSITQFYYGLGYQPTDNLQIDLIGFLGYLPGMQILDAEFFRSWRLSFTLKL